MSIWSPGASRSGRSRARCATPQFGSTGREDPGAVLKLHLFDALNYRESDHVQAGDEICLLDTDIGRVGIQICYDCRFPELARTQVLKGRICCASWPAFPWARLCLSGRSTGIC